MNREPSESSSADRIQAALDEMVAQRRRQRVAPASFATGNSGPASSPSPTTLPKAPSSAPRWVLIGLLAVTVHAAGFYWYTHRSPVDRGLVLVAEPAPPLHAGEVNPPVPRHVPSPNEPTASLASNPPQPIRSVVAGGAGVIEHQGKVIVVTPSPPAFRPAPQKAVVATAAAAPAPARPETAPEPVRRVTNREHAKAAEEFAYHHFRYKYKVGSTHYAVTSQNVRITRTEEVPAWNRHRSTGEVGLEYYDGSGFRRTTRRFEVLTEEKDGSAQGFEITVKL